MAMGKAVVEFESGMRLMVDGGMKCFFNNPEGLVYQYGADRVSPSCLRVGLVIP